MAPREAFKDIELSGRKWRIGRFNALTGSYVAFKLLTQILPMGLDAQLGGSLPGLPSGRSIMSKQDFMDLQIDCLRCCCELKEVGGVLNPLNVIMADGSWGVPDLEQDPLTVIMLTVHVLIFNMSSFFADGALTQALPESLRGLSPFSAKESTPSPGDQS